MGRGIAQVAAVAGCRVIVHDVEQRFLDAGMEALRKSVAKAVEKGKLSAGDAAATLARVDGTNDLEAAVRDADLVIEAIPEDLGLKQRVFEHLGALCRADTVLATNTSSLPITQVASHARHPQRCVGMHFFNPPPIMKLLEIVKGEKTDDATIDLAVALGRRWDKEPIVVRDSPGFASSRLGIALGLEAMRMVEEDVASPADIDKAMEYGYRHPMGPLRLTDLVGLDVRLAIAEALLKAFGERFRPPELLRRMVREGKLGQKSGRGFYGWET
jgi:3-hydroxybutyryl-CoA dehydrogenase